MGAGVSHDESTDTSDNIANRWTILTSEVRNYDNFSSRKYIHTVKIRPPESQTDLAVDTELMAYELEFQLDGLISELTKNIEANAKVQFDLTNDRGGRPIHIPLKPLSKFQSSDITEHVMRITQSNESFRLEGRWIIEIVDIHEPEMGIWQTDIPAKRF